jgi:membrane-bound ClpP family serine protease
MNNKNRIQEELEKTLNSLDGIQRAPANPYLFTRVKARLENEEKSFWGRALTVLSRPSVAVSAIVLTILINTAIFFEFGSEKVQIPPDEEQAFAREYNLSDNTIYESTIEPE